MEFTVWLDSKTNSRITLNPTNNCAFLAALRLLRRRGCISEWGYPWAPLIVAAVALAMSGNLWLVRPVRSSIGFAVTLLGLFLVVSKRADGCALCDRVGTRVCCSRLRRSIRRRYRDGKRSGGSSAAGKRCDLRAVRGTIRDGKGSAAWAADCGSEGDGDGARLIAGDSRSAGVRLGEVSGGSDARDRKRGG